MSDDDTPSSGTGDLDSLLDLGPNTLALRTRRSKSEFHDTKERKSAVRFQLAKETTEKATCALETTQQDVVRAAEVGSQLVEQNKLLKEALERQAAELKEKEKETREMGKIVGKLKFQLQNKTTHNVILQGKMEELEKNATFADILGGGISFGQSFAGIVDPQSFLGEIDAVQALEEELKELDALVLEVQQQLEAETKKRQELEEQLELAQEVVNTSAELGSLKNEELEERLLAAQTENERLREELTGEKAQKALRNAIAKVEEENQQKLARAQEALKATEMKLRETVELEAKAAAEEKQNLASQIEELEETLRVAKAKEKEVLERGEAQLAEMTERLQDMMQTNEEARKLFEKIQESREALLASAHEEELTLANQERESVLAAITTLHSQNLVLLQKQHEVAAAEWNQAQEKLLAQKDFKAQYLKILHDETAGRSRIQTEENQTCVKRLLEDRQISFKLFQSLWHRKCQLDQAIVASQDEVFELMETIDTQQQQHEKALQQQEKEFHEGKSKAQAAHFERDSEATSMKASLQSRIIELETLLNKQNMVRETLQTDHDVKVAQMGREIQAREAQWQEQIQQTQTKHEKEMENLIKQLEAKNAAMIERERILEETRLEEVSALQQQLKSERDHIQEISSTQTSEMERLQAAHKTYMAELISMAEENSAKEVDRWQKALAAQKEDFDSMHEATANRYEKTVAALKTELEESERDANARFAMTQRGMDSKEIEIDQLTVQLHELQAKYKAEQLAKLTETSELSREVEIMTQRLNETKRMNQISIDEKESEMEALKSKLMFYEGGVQSLQGTMQSALEQEQVRLADTQRRAEQEIKALKEKETQLLGTVDSQKSQFHAQMAVIKKEHEIETTRLKGLIEGEKEFASKQMKTMQAVLEAEAERMKGIIESQREKLSGVSQEHYSTLIDETEAIRNRIHDSSKDHMENIEKLNSQHAKQIQELRQTITDLKTKSEEQETQLSSKIAQLTAQLHSSTSHHEYAILERQIEIDNLKKTLNIQQSEIDGIHRGFDETHGKEVSRLDDAYGKKDNVHLEQLRSLKATHDTEVGWLKQEAQDLKMHYDNSLEITKKQHQAEVARLEKALVDLKAISEEHRVKSQQVKKEEIEWLRGQYEANVHQVDSSAKNFILCLERDLKACEGQNAQLWNLQKAHDEAMEMLRQDRQEACDKFLELESAMRSLELAARPTSAKIKALEARSAQQLAQLQSLNGQLEEAEGLSRDYQVQLRKLQIKQAEWQKERAILQEALTDAMEMCDELNHERKHQKEQRQAGVLECTKVYQHELEYHKEANLRLATETLQWQSLSKALNEEKAALIGNLNSSIRHTDQPHSHTYWSESPPGSPRTTAGNTPRLTGGTTPVMAGGTPRRYGGTTPVQAGGMQGSTTPVQAGTHVSASYRRTACAGCYMPLSTLEDCIEKDNLRYHIQCDLPMPALEVCTYEN